MRVLQPLTLGMWLAALPMASFAWDHQISRGLDLYQVDDNGMSLALVCDPANVYGGTTQTGLLVGIDGNVDATIPATFRFPDGISVQAEIFRGRIGQARTEDGAWTALLDGFRTQSSVTVEVAGQVRDVDLGERVMFTCT